VNVTLPFGEVLGEQYIPFFKWREMENINQFARTLFCRIFFLIFYLKSPGVNMQQVGDSKKINNLRTRWCTERTVEDCVN
jgi:hypothetical protein